MSIHQSWRGLLPDVVREVGPRTAIYHYTSPDGLLGILQHHELWATQASGMNDVAEVRQGWDFIDGWLEAQDASDRAVGVMREFATEDGPNTVERELKSPEGVFMCCATLRHDDANQWRLYGGRSRGYSVELEPRIALTMLVPGTKPPPSSPKPGWIDFTEEAEQLAITPWLHVLYTDEDKTAALDGLLAAAQQRYADFDWSLPEDDGRVELELLEYEIWAGLARIAQLMKSEGFSGEHEVRVIVTPPQFVKDSTRYRATPDGIVRYCRLTQDPAQTRKIRVAYEAEVERSKTLPIRSVTLGPLLHAQNNRATIETLLASNKLQNVYVHTSGVPLRS